MGPLLFLPPHFFPSFVHRFVEWIQYWGDPIFLPPQPWRKIHFPEKTFQSISFVHDSMPTFSNKRRGVEPMIYVNDYKILHPHYLPSFHFSITQTLYFE